MKPISFVRYKYSTHGGAEKYLSRITQALQKQNTPYEILSTKSYDSHSKIIKVSRWLPRFLQVLQFSQAIRAYAHQHNAFIFSLERIATPAIYRAGDGVHKEWLSIRARQSFANRISWVFKPLNWVYLSLERTCFKNAKAIIANSHRGKEEIIRHYGINADKIHVIHNGIAQKAFDTKASRRILEEEFGLKQDIPLFLYVGSGFERKGVTPLLQLLSQLNEMDFHAFIIGKEKKIKRYKILARKLGLEDKVTFTGIRNDTEQFYAASDIFLFPTRYEPFSNACLEAMGYGCALITTRQNGVSEIVPTPELIMETPEDQNILIHIKKLLQSPSLLHNVQQSHQETTKHMSIEKNLRQTLELTQSIMYENIDTTS